MQPALILFSGLPGTGKTTLARAAAGALGVPLLAKDRIARVLRDQVPGAAPVAGYYLLLDLAEEQLGLGLSVIVDAVFPWPGFRDEARAVAARQGARFAPIACVCSDEAAWRARLATRVPYVPGWAPVGWAEVERQRPEYRPWPAGTALQVDAVRPVAENCARVLAYLRAPAGR